MKISLKMRFLIPMAILVAIGMGTFTAVSYFKSKNALVEASQTQINQLAASTLSIVDAWFADRKLEIRNWSAQKVFQSAVTDTFVGKAARKAANNQLAKLKEDYTFYESIYLATRSGKIVAASVDMAEQAETAANEQFFQEAVRSKNGSDVIVSDVYLSALSKNPVFAVASPLINSGVVTGVLYGVLDIDAFSKQFIDPIKVGKTGYAFAFNKDGLVISHPDKSQIMTMNLKEYDFGREMLSGEQGLLDYAYNDEDKMGAFRTSPELGWTICISASTEEVLAAVNSVRIFNLVVTSAIVVLAVIFILVIASSTVRPINQTISGLEQAVEQVVSGATQVAASSQTLSSGASEQAATIEETSSSLEEMASMTRQNADNAGAAKSKMAEATQIVQRVNSHMGDMAEAIQEITHSRRKSEPGAP